MKDHSAGGIEGYSLPLPRPLSEESAEKEAALRAVSDAETAAARLGGLPSAYALRCVRTCRGYVRGGEKKGMDRAAALSRAIALVVEDEDGHCTQAELRTWMESWDKYLETMEEGE